MIGQYVFLLWKLLGLQCSIRWLWIDILLFCTWHYLPLPIKYLKNQTLQLIISICLFDINKKNALLGQFNWREIAAVWRHYQSRTMFKPNLQVIYATQRAKDESSACSKSMIWWFRLDIFYCRVVTVIDMVTIARIVFKSRMCVTSNLLTSQ